MSYITHAQLNERPGALELSQVATALHERAVPAELMEAALTGGDTSSWSADEIARAQDAIQRIDDAVADAVAVIDGYLAKRGYLPLDPVPPMVSVWCRAITRYYLHQNNSGTDDKDPIVRDYKDALRFLQLTADGKFSLGADDTVENSPNAVEIQIDSDPKVFGRDQLKAFR